MDTRKLIFALAILFMTISLQACSTSVKRPDTPAVVPALKVKIDCGECNVRATIPKIIVDSYNFAAIVSGTTVDESKTTEMTIKYYIARGDAERFLVGAFAGKDEIKTEVLHNGKIYLVEDYYVNAWLGIETLAEEIGKQTFNTVVSNPGSGTTASSAPAIDNSASSPAATTSATGISNQEVLAKVETQGAASPRFNDKKVLVTAWGFLTEHHIRPSEEIYSSLISGLMKEELQKKVSIVDVASRDHAVSINYENEGYPHSKSLCSSSKADIIVSGYLDNTLTSVWQHPEMTWYSYNCSTGEREFETYTLNLKTSDKKGFKYEKDVKRTFRDFLIIKSLV